MSDFSFVFAVLMLGLAAGYLGLFIRALPWPARLKRVRAPRWLGGKTLWEKPFNCAICMGGWSTILLNLLLGEDVSALWLAEAAVATALFSHVLPPEIPLPGEDADQ